MKQSLPIIKNCHNLWGRGDCAKGGGDVWQVKMSILNSKTKKTYEKSVETGSVTDQERPSCWLSAVFNGIFPMVVGTNYCQYWCAHLIIKKPLTL